MLSKEDLHTFYEPKKKIEGNIALIAPGTGLGEAGLYWDGNFYHPFANEGGGFKSISGVGNSANLHCPKVVRSSRIDFIIVQHPIYGFGIKCSNRSCVLLDNS